MTSSIRAHCLRALWLLLAGASALAGTAGSLLDHSTLLAAVPGPYNGSTALAPLEGYGGEPIRLKLCECERATGPPNGLGCDKEGWFISSFERQGQWVAGGGYVPLSHAICCRPCLPGELPPDPSGRIPGGAKPLAIISLGCHSSTDVLSTRCELEAGSFVSGYSEAVKVFTTPDSYYPVNTVSCCSPALLLENGDAWELERCGCHDSRDPNFPVNCGGTNTHELLWGFVFFRLSPLGHVVPVGPAQCCSVCLSSTVHPINQCDDLNSCSGHGVCRMRRCECFDGWAGADCSQGAGGSKSVPPWAIALIVLSSSALAGILIIAAGYALQALGVSPGSPAGSEDGDAEAREPLLIRIDPDDVGSVGSADTSDGEDEVDAEEVERRVHNAIERLEHAAAGGAPQQQAVTAQAAGAAGAAAAAGAEAAVEVAAAGSREPAAGEAAASCHHQGGGAGGTQQEQQPAEAAAERHDTAAEEGAAPPAEAEVAPAPGAPAAGGGSAVEAAADDEPVKPPRDGCGLTPEGPLAMVDCSVCMSRPVQVVAVPCGHIAMCRRCSRRLNRCPICRKEIARRQRLYV